LPDAREPILETLETYYFPPECTLIPLRDLCKIFLQREHSVYHLHCSSLQTHTNTDETHATLNYTYPRFFSTYWIWLMCKITVHRKQQ